MYFFSLTVNAAIVERNLTFNNADSLVLNGESLLLTADFSGTFASINTILFNFYYEGDLFDNFEQYMLGPFELSSTLSVRIGKINEYGYSLSSATTGTYGTSPEADLFLDGYQNFFYTAEVGSMNLSSATIVIDGDFTASPVPLPTAFWLFGTGLISLLTFIRHKQSS